jgi:hypothetical protein
MLRSPQHCHIFCHLIGVRWHPRFVDVQLFRTLLRISILLCLAAAAVTLTAMNGEYPFSTVAGQRVIVREVLPLALIAWVNLCALERAYPLQPRAKTWIATAALVNIVMLARTAPAASRGAAPLTLALPIIATFLLVSMLGLSVIASRRVSTRSDD